MIEIEKRAIINETKLVSLVSKLTETSTHNDKFKRFTMVKIDNADFVPKKNSLLDIKIRTSNRESLFTIKTGNWHSDISRTENEIHFNKEEIIELISILIALGYKYFVAIYITRIQFQVDGMAITIDKYHHLEDCLVEVEISSKLNNNKEAESKIDTFLRENKLKPLTSEETINFITKINMLKKTQINFEHMTVTEWAKQWKDFINCNV